MTVTLADIARATGASIDASNAGMIISGLASIENAGPEHISFISNKRYSHFLPDTRAGAVIVKSPDGVPENTVALIVDDPYFAFIAVLDLFNSRSPADIASGIHEQASVDLTAELGANVGIGPCAVIGPGVKIGDNTVVGACTVIMKDSVVGKNCIFYPNVSVMDSSIIGDRVILHSGAVIGADGFGFAPHNNALIKIPQIGIVRLGDDVEIQANTCVDRAAFGETVIGNGVKVDNFVQIAHNVKIGAHSILTSQAGIAGSTTLGKGVIMAGKSGIAGHLTIGDGVTIAGSAGVTKDVESGRVVSGFPSQDHSAQMRFEASLRKIPELLKTVRQQEKRIIELEKALHIRDESE